MGSTKLQTTVTGYTAFVIATLADHKDKTPAEITSYLLERWIDDNREYLRGQGITQERFDLEKRGGKVVHLDRSNDG